MLGSLFGPPAMTVELLREKLASPTPPVVVDVRDSAECVETFIPNSVVIPLGSLMMRTQELPKDRDVVFYCGTGGRSAQAARILRAKGFSNAYNLKGGLQEWLRKVGPCSGIVL